MNTDKLTGTTVITRDGRQLGTVTTIELDEATWRVTALGVRLDRNVCEDFGIHRRIFGQYTVNISTDHVVAASDTIVLDTTLAELEQKKDEVSGKRERAAGSAAS